jgi:hypothetical protein
VLERLQLVDCLKGRVAHRRGLWAEGRAVRIVQCVVPKATRPARVACAMRPKPESYRPGRGGRTQLGTAERDRP